MRRLIRGVILGHRAAAQVLQLIKDFQLSQPNAAVLCGRGDEGEIFVQVVRPVQFDHKPLYSVFITRDDRTVFAGKAFNHWFRLRLRLTSPVRAVHLDHSDFYNRSCVVHIG